MTTFKTLDLAIGFDQVASAVELKGHLKDQLIRAASSISLNLSEDNARASARDKRNVFQTAYGSLRECQTIFKLARVACGEAVTLADCLGASLYKLVHSQLKNSPNWR